MNQIQFNNDLLALKKKLYYYAMSLTSDPNQADDLLQDTLLKALMFRDKFRQDTNFKAWVYTIMKNTFINEYRRNVKIKNRSIDSSYEVCSPTDVYPAPDSFYITREIQRIINALKDDFRIPFNFFLEGYRYKEIADRLSLPLGTVKSRIFFTRKKLKESLNRDLN